jgi:hypothetical protein
MTSQYFGGRISGGAIGGFHALEKYHEGQLAAEKALLVRNIAHDLKNVLHFSADTERQPIDSLVALLRQKLPNVRRSQGRLETLSDASGHQRAICQALASSINSRFGRHVIDSSAEPGRVCLQVSEVMNSLFSGLNGEFMGVATDIKRVLGNLQILRNSMIQSFDKIMETVNDSGSDRAQLEAMPVYQIFKGEIGELDRQIAMLSNLTNVVMSPTTRTIADLTAEDTDFRGYVRSLKEELGSPDLSRKMSYVLANVSNVAMLAAQIDRAFKAAGLDVSEFKRAKSPSKLLEHLHTSFERAHRHPTAQEVNKFVTAVQMVRENDYAYDDIASELSKRAGKTDGHKVVRRAARHARNARRKKRGGGLSGTGDMTLEKRMERQRKTREVLFTDFERRLEDQYRQIAAAVDVLAKRFGQQVKMDDNLRKFVSCMGDLKRDGVEREKFYLALTGYQQDAGSREERQRFLGHLGAVANSLKPLIASSSGSERQHFESIKSAVEDVVRTIDTFKDTYLKPISQISFKVQGGARGDAADKVAPRNRADYGSDNETEVQSHYAETMSAEHLGQPSTEHSDGAQESELEADSDDDAVSRGQAERERYLADNIESHISQVERREDDSAANDVVRERGRNFSPRTEEDEVRAAQDAASAALERNERDGTPLNDDRVEGGGATGGSDGEGTFVTLSQAIRHLDFYYQAARVKHNLDISAKDIKSYSKGYETLLGDAVGDYVVQIKKRYEQARQKYDINAQPLNLPTTLPQPAEALFIKEWIDESGKPGSFGPDGTVTGAGGTLTAAELKQWRTSVKDSALKFLKDQMTAQIDLLKTVEAIDIYLMNFADAIASNPDSIKDLSQMLKSVDIVGKWFTDRSGNTVAEFLESTPSALISQFEVRPQADDAWDQNQENHYYKWVEKLLRGGTARTRAGVVLPANPFLGTLPGKHKDAEESVYDQIIDKAKRAAHSVRVLDNIVSTFAKLGSQASQGQTFMPPGVIFKNLRQYLFHSSIVMGMEGENSLTETISGQVQRTPIGAHQPTAPVMAAIPNAAALATASNVQQGQTMQVGVMGMAAPVGAATMPRTGAYVGAVPMQAAAALETGIKAGAPTDIIRQAAEQWVRNRFALAFSAIPGARQANGDLGKPINGYSSSWQQTDEFFIMAIKAMVAKIFTVIGTYGAFNKPLDKYKSISSTRLILGGDAQPDIKPEAVELYIRLPLLAEFYRSVFEFENDDPTKLPNNWVTMDKGISKKITLVPEFDGVWENFIKTVFVDAKYISEGSYSEQHVKAMIREINDIYNKYRNASSTVQDVISAFVAEINRRYGIVKQDDVKNYLKDRRRYDVNEDRYAQGERLDYNILGERDQEGRGPAPSDRFDHAFAATTARKSENPWDNHYVDMVYKFRNRIDAQLKNLMPKDGKPPKVSFDSTVRAYKMQVEHAKDNKDRYRIVLKAMQGTDQLSTVNTHKAMMFHEIVVAPLGTLYSVWTVLNQFIRRIRALDTEEIEKRILEAIDAAPAGGVYNYAYFFAKLRGDPNKPSYGYERYLHRGYNQDLNVALGGGSTVRMPTLKLGSGQMSDVLVYRGTYGAREDITWASIDQLATVARTGAGEAKKRAREGLQRFLVDRESLFRDLVNLTFALGGDLGETVQVKIQSHSMLVEYGQLAEYCQTLLSSVKKNIELFRGTIDDSVIRRVEGGEKKKKGANTGVTGPQPGSLYFIEEYLMERVLKNSRQGAYNPSARARARDPDLADSIGIVMTNEIIGRTFKRFCSKWEVIAKLDGVGAARTFGLPTQEDVNGTTIQEKDLKPLPLALFKHEQSLLRDSFERPMAELLYWQTNSKPSAPVAGAPGAPAHHVDLRHPLKQPRVTNKSVDEFPFAVIPSIERSSNEDDDIKTLKDIQSVMRSIQDELAVLCGATAAAGGGGAALLASPTNIGVWKYPQAGAAAPAVWGEVLGNFGVMVDADVDSAGAPTNITLRLMAAGAGAPVVPRILEMGQKYNSLYAQRERIFQSSIRTPIDHRGKWYTDPANPKEGAWFLNQLSSAEADAGISAEDRRANQDQFKGGLLLRLNEILAKYLYAGWDTTKRAMYQGLIAKFASGSHITATSKGEALNDINLPFQIWERSGLHSGIMGVPASHVTVFASLARAMRNIMTNTRRSGDPQFRVDTMMELPIHMKETLKAALPGFNKLFASVIKKAELLRHIAQQVSLLRQNPYAFKYGVNIQPDPAAAGAGMPAVGAAMLSPGAAFTGRVVAAQYGTATLPAPNNRRNVISPIRWNGSMLRSSEMHVNQALLEPNDLIHMDTGFVVRGVTDNTAIADVITDAATRLGAAWARGDDVAAPGSFWRGGERFTGIYAKRMCWNAQDRAAQLYVGYSPYVDLSEDASKRWHVELIDSIAGTAMSLGKCATDTYKELADEPKYLETHEGFISDYVQMNKRQPIMLLSQLQVALRPRFRDSASAQPNGGEWEYLAQAGYARANFMLPFYRSGESPFKLQYGARLVLGRPDVKPGLEYMPGMSSLLEQYNGVSSADSRVEKADFELAAIAHTQLLRFMTDLRFTRAALDTAYSGRLYGNIYPNPPGALALPAPNVSELIQVAQGSALFDAPLDIPAELGAVPGRWPKSAEYIFPEKSRPYTMQITLEEDLAITESSDQDDTLKSFVSSLRGPDGNIDNRSTARIYNILDMNIVPINVHALQREIPLVNLINYAYTCDRMIQDKLMPDVELPGQGNPNQGRIISVDPNDPDKFQVQSTAGMLTKLLIYPYAQLDDEEYYGYVHRIMAGDSGLELGRPKFISDQLWNKVLFQELYTQQGFPSRKNSNMRNRPDEAGPREDAARRRALRTLHSNYDHLIMVARALLIDPAVMVPGGIRNAARQFLGGVIQADAAVRQVIAQIAAAAGPLAARVGGPIVIPASIASDRRVLSAFRDLAPLLDAARGVDTDAYVMQVSPQLRQVFQRVQERIVQPAAPVPSANLREIQEVAMASLLFTMVEVALNDGKEPAYYENNGTLQYPDEDDDGNKTIETAELSVGDPNRPLINGVSESNVRSDLAVLGRLRFDTTFIRNIFFLVNLQRVMRMIMRDEIQFLESPVVNSSAVLNRQITEYQGNEQFDSEVFES